MKNIYKVFILPIAFLSWVATQAQTNPFITRWDLSKKSATATSLSFGVVVSGAVSYTWQEVSPGTASGSGTIPVSTTTATIINLPAGKTIDLSIDPINFQRININNLNDKIALVDVKQWGDVAWTSMVNAFFGCTNLNISATDVPNLSATGISIASMFRSCTNLNGPANIGTWNVSKVTNMNAMFLSSPAFNQNISDWNIALVTDMTSMFNGATAFNQSLADWGTKFNALVNLGNFLNNCGMSMANYDATLTGFNAGTVTGRNMGATGRVYCSATAARANLVLASGGKGWTITGDALCVPEINVKGNNTNIVNGDVTPSTTDHTDFGIISQTLKIVRTFTIENLGQLDLTLSGSPIVNVTGTHAADFTVTTLPTSPVLPASITTFQVTFIPSATGLRTATINIANNDSNENPYTFAVQGTGDGNAFVTRWDVAPSATQLSFGVATGGTVTYNWQEVSPGTDSGFGSFSGSTATITGLPTGATIDLMISPTNFQRININNGTDKSRLTDVKQWGNVAWTSMATAFYGCNNLNITATDVPTLSGVTAMNAMFQNCTSLNGPSNIGSWNVSAVTNTTSMFNGATSFNQNIGSWNVSALTNATSMFQGATAFNQNIGAWNIGAITNMTSMLSGASAFNQSLADWGTKLNANVGLSNFLNNCGMNTANYDATLTGFNASTLLSRTLGATGLVYCNAAADRANLVLSVANGGKGWTITDGGSCPLGINLKGNNTNIIRGSTTSSTTNHTYFGAIATTSGAIVRTFTIENIGSSVLSLTGTPMVTVSGTHATDFTVTVLPAASIAVSGNTTFQITFDPSAAGIRNATVSIANSDLNGNPYTFAIQGYGDGSPFVTRWNLATTGSGTTQLSFPVVTNGTVFYTWQQIAPGTAAGSGSFSGTTATITGLPPGATIDLRISPLNFQRIIINGGTDRNRLTDVSQWGDVAWTSMANAFDLCTNLNISATDIPNLAGVTSMSLMFRSCTTLNGPTNIGSWNVSTVSDMNNMFLSASAFNQSIGAWNISSVTNMNSMFSGATAFNQSLADWGTKFRTNVDLSGLLNNCGMNTDNYDATLVGFNSGTVTGRSLGATGRIYCAATAARDNLILPVANGGKGWTIWGDALCAPEINVRGNNNDIANGSTFVYQYNHTDFGMVSEASGSIVRTFTIQNLGHVNLNLTGSPIINITGANAADFTVTALPTSPVTGYGSTTFQITFDPSAVGLRNATVNIANNDSNENPYTFAIQGNGEGRHFVTRWNLATAGSGATQLSFPMITAGNVNYTWQEVGGGGASGAGTFYANSANNYFVTFSGLPAGATIDLSISPFNLNSIWINGVTDKNRLVDVKQWGDVAWTNMGYAFYGCTNLNITATDLPNLSGVASMSRMFSGCTALNGPSNMGSWNVSNVTDMSYMFENATSFNQSLGAWGLQLNPDVNLTYFLYQCGMNVANYDATLTGFNAGTVTGRTMDATGLKYCASASDRANLVLSVANGGKGWTITGDALCTPEINLKGNNVSIVSGDVTPSGTDHTDFGLVNLPSGSVVRTFTVENLGTGNLTLNGTPQVNITGAHAADFTVTVLPNSPIAAAASTTFQITFAPSAPNTRTATVSIANNDSNENPYTFAIQGTANGNAFITRWNLATAGSGATQLSFNVTTTGTVPYTWQEVGGGGATGSGTFSGTTATITGLPAGATIDLNIESAYFKAITINNGTDKSRLIDIKQWGDVAWTNMQVAFYGCNNLNISATDIPDLTGVSNMNSMFYNCSSLNGPTNIGSWNVSNVTSMNAAFAYTTSFNQSLGAWGTKFHPAVDLTNMLDNCGMSITNYDATLTGFNAGTVTGRSLGAFSKIYCASATDRANLVLAVASGGKGWNITGDQICTPEINLKGNNVSITAGDIYPALADHTDFGDASVASGTVVRTFTIENSGTGNLTLTGTPKVTITGTNASDFTVTVLPNSPVVAASNTTFEVTFDPSAAGNRVATVYIQNNDSNENPYTFAIKGTGIGDLTPTLTVGMLTHPTTCASTDGSIPFITTNIADGNYMLSYKKNTIDQTANITIQFGAFTLGSLTGGIYSNFSLTINSNPVTLATPQTLNTPTASIAVITANSPTTCAGNNGLIQLSTTNIPAGNYTLNYQKNSVAQTVPIYTNGFFLNLNNLTAGTYSDFSMTVGVCTATLAASQTLTDPSPILNVAIQTNTACDSPTGVIIIQTDAMPFGTYTLSYKKNTVATTTSITTSSDPATPSTINANDGYYTDFSITYGSCTATAPQKITMGSANIWTGTTSQAWDTATNWSKGIVPTGVVKIPAWATNQPTISTAETITDIVVDSGATLTIAPSGNLYLSSLLTCSNIVFLNNGTVQNNGMLRIYINLNFEGLEDYGIHNVGTFNNGSTGTLDIWGFLHKGLYNQESGVMTNAGLIKINTNNYVSPDRYGYSLWNAGVFTNSDSIEIDYAPAAAIYNKSSTAVKAIFNNNGAVVIGKTNGNYDRGIDNVDTFNNNSGSSISIGKILLAAGIAINSTGNFTNVGSINLGGLGVIRRGIVNTGNFNNNSLGTISIQQTFNAIPLTNGLDFINNGTVEINAGAPANDALYSQGTLINNTCAKLIVLVGKSNFTGTVSNLGLMQLTNNLTNTSTFNNDGILAYSSLTGTAITNNDVIIAPVSACENEATSVLQIGGANSFTIANTWYSDAAQTMSSGTYTTATNSFISTQAVPGTYTNYLSITDANNCERIVPITITLTVVPTLTAGTVTPPSNCSSSDGSITFTTTLNNGSYSLNYSKNGIVQTPQTIFVSSNAFEFYFLSAGNYSNFSITSNGCVSADASTKVVSPSQPTQNVTGPITSGTVVIVATQTITATNQVSNASVTYKAGESVTLLPGFQATGNKFEAVIGSGCN